MSDESPAHRDPRLEVRIIDRKRLRYRRGADSSIDRPAHVRASSALCWVGDDLLVLQDDAAFLGIVDPSTGWVEDLPLPAGAGGRRLFDAGRGNKDDKPDFELGFTDGQQLIAMGSGGLRARQQILTWRRGHDPTLTALPRLYDQLRAALVGHRNLNLEGGALLGEWMVLANRGGDAGSADALVYFARTEFAALLADPQHAPLPTLRVQTVALATLAAPGPGAHALRFTDLAPRAHALRFTDLAPRGDGLWYLAAAEQTDSFYDDGAVAGSALGVIRELDRTAPTLRFAPICDHRGQPTADKVEGIASHALPDRLWAVTDPDDPERAGELLELQLSGPW